GALEGPDHLRGLDRVRLKPNPRPALDDPVEDQIVILSWGDGMCQAEQIAVRPAIALLVLHSLEGHVLRCGLGVPLRYRPTQAATPAAQRIDVSGEVKQVCPDAADLGQRFGHCGARLRITVSAG